MTDILYAVHTRTCTYLLDDGGVCRWIVSPTGMLPADVRHCVGAQFVACLDLRIAGGLIGELRIGASALFVRDVGDGTGRMLLLRTASIEHVEFREASEALPSEPAHAPIFVPPPNPPPAPPPAARPPPQRAERPPVDDSDSEIELDTDDLVVYTDEVTVTLTLPLYRPEAQPSPPGGPRGGRDRSRR